MEKECPKCSGEMYLEDVLVGRTTSANEEDSFAKVWVCEECGHEEDTEN